jgi:hypothetical protein
VRIVFWLLVVAVTIVLGSLGVRDLRSVQHSHWRSWPESIYRSVRLYTLGLGPASGGGPGSPQPNTLLWIALALAALLVLLALLALALDRVRRASTRWVLRGHVIVCGGGCTAPSS